MKRILIVLAGLLAGGPAQADLLEEARLGVLDHNICMTDCKNADKEDGPNIQAELVFASPGVLRYVASPRPYVIGSWNTQADTSYGGFGLVWNFDIADKWSVEPSLGYVVHTGATKRPFASGSPQAAEFAANNVLLGSRDLFRTAIALDRRIGERWGVQLIFEHMSHGQVIGDGRNQGLDNAGIRLFWEFGA